VAVVMQAGTSGGLLPSEVGQPIGIDRPALYFPRTPFVLSHTGWPWVDEAVAMALKFPNVYLGTASYPPRHWSPAVVEFARRAGKSKVLFGTNFPTVGHRHALAQLEELNLDGAVIQAMLEGNARRVFTRLPKKEV
jgi:predicted TIM-barrel fold metal-dependent hydrolase